MLKPAARTGALSAVFAPRETPHHDLWALLGLGAALTLVSNAATHPLVQTPLLTSGVAAIVLGLIVGAGRAVASHLRARDLVLLRGIYQKDTTPCFLIRTSDQRVIWANPAALAEASILPDDAGAVLFDGLSADPEELCATLLREAQAQGSSRHQIDSDASVVTYVVTCISDAVCLLRRETTAKLDPRDASPLNLISFESSGACSYVSPALRGKFKLPALGTMFEGGAPPVFSGKIIKAPQVLAGKYALALPADAEGLQSFALLPPMPQLAPSEMERAALDAMPVALAQLEADGTFRYLNNHARKLLHFQRPDGRMFSDLLEGLGRPVTEWLSDVAHGRIEHATEILRRRQGDTEIFIKVTLSRRADANGHYIMAVLDDVTELKSLEAKFTQSQKMQAIGQLAGGVAHDFNNLLTAISGHCDLLLLRHDRSDLDFPDLMQIQQNTNRAAALVRQLLALSRQQTLRFVTLDLQDTMGDVIHLLNRLVGEKITLTLRSHGAVAPIRCDKRQFEQILMNLVVNARDAMPMGGEIRIETETCTYPDGIARDGVQMPAGDYTLIHVRDQGTGISETNLEKIFDPFFTTKRPGEGTGLGLSTVYGIVKQSGGYIFVDSTEGEGTCFTLYFAAQDPSQLTAQPTRRNTVFSATLDITPALILLVEDEAPVRSFAARALELQGHKVIEADCGEAALELLADPSIRPDFFVTDVIMPGIDGPGWIAQVRARFPETPVLFISGYAEDSRVAAQARISNATFLGKPFTLAEFTTCVNTQLKRHARVAA